MQMRQKGKCCRRKWRVERGGDGAWKGEKDGAAAHANGEGGCGMEGWRAQNGKSDRPKMEGREA